MSWDADFYAVVDGSPIHVRDWNYTHNTNNMANATLDLPHDKSVFDEVFSQDTSWWHLLNDSSGIEGEQLLRRIIKGLEAAPERFRAMNPDNGWGSYDKFLGVLKEMLETSAQFPSGRWEVSG